VVLLLLIEMVILPPAARRSVADWPERVNWKTVAE